MLSTDESAVDGFGTVPHTLIPLRVISLPDDGPALGMVEYPPNWPHIDTTVDRTIAKTLAGRAIRAITRIDARLSPPLGSASQPLRSPHMLIFE